MGSCCSKFLRTIFNILNPFYKTTHSSVPTTKPLPLLRLPSLALIEVFKSLDPIELFILSLCSRKTANRVHIVDSEKWKLSVDVENKCITINKIYRLIIIESSQKPSWKYDRESKTFSLEYQNIGNNKLELQKVLAQLLIAFKCPVTSFAYTDWIGSDQCWVPVLNCIIQNQTQPLESFDLCGTFKRDDLMWALQNVRVSQEVNIYLSEMPGYELVSFPSSFCLHVDLLKFKSCKFIKLTLSCLTMHALDVFMKGWKTGSFPNLRYMLIKGGNFKSDDRILGFSRSKMKKLSVRRRLVIDEKRSVECTGGVDIQSDSGTKATMQMNRVPPDWFELFVWNN